MNQENNVNVTNSDFSPNNIKATAKKYIEASKRMHNYLSNMENVLTAVRNISGKYDPNLKIAVETLMKAIENYDIKSVSLLNQISDGIYQYGYRLENNINELINSINSVVKLINEL